MRRLRVSRSLCALVGVSACTDEPGGSAWDGIVKDSAGIQLVENRADGLWAAGRPWELLEVVRIGAADGDLDYQFGEIAGVTLGDSGEIFVLDQHTADVRVFTPDGVFRRSFGGPGAGPGELASGGVAALLNGPGDTLFVADMGNQRVVRFLESGQSAGGFRVDFVDRGIPLQWAALPTGKIVVHLHPFPQPDEAALDVRDAIVALDGHGAVLDTLLTTAVNPMFVVRAGKPSLLYFAAQPTWTLGDSGSVYYGLGDEYRIGHFARGGTLTRVVGKTFTPQPVTEQDQTILLDAFAELMVRQQATPTAVRQFRDEARFAETFAAYRAFHSGPHGTLWVQRVTPLRELGPEVFGSQLHAGSSTWEVFGPDGRFLGAVPMPPRFTPLEFIDDRIYGVWRNDVDVQHLMVLRIVLPRDAQSR